MRSQRVHQMMLGGMTADPPELILVLKREIRSPARAPIFLGWTADPAKKIPSGIVLVRNHGYRGVDC